MHSDYHDDERFCPACNRYVRYLLAMDVAHCVECGDRVRIYSGPDLKRVLGEGRGWAEPRDDESVARLREAPRANSGWRRR